MITRNTPNSINTISTEVVICKCSSSEHQIIIRTFENDEDDEIYLDIHLASRPFLERVKYAFKYIFGYKSKYGAWDEFILDKTEFKIIIKQI
jgi:hypothetical protein